MSWIEVAFEIKHNQVEQGTQLLEQLGALAVTCYDAKDEPIFEPPPLSEPIHWEDSILVGLMENTCAIDQISESLLKEFPQTQVTAKNLEDKNWVAYVQSKFPAKQFGKLWIVPSWNQTETQQDEVVLSLDPGVAFGTGTHPTTHLCLEWIAQASLAGQTIIDFGCGSGILGLACALLGAPRVYAIDHCPQSVQATMDNRDKNKISQSELSVHLPDDACLEPLQVDCIIANILAGPILSLEPNFIQFLKPGGTLILSGLLEEQVEEIQAQYQTNFEWIEQTNLEGWSRLTLKKKLS